MKVVIQRTKYAKVEVNGKLINEIPFGYMILVSFTDGDNDEIINAMAKKIANLRIFDDEVGIMNKSILDVGGKILSISQFTLYADTKKGNRPSYIHALKSEYATLLYNKFNEVMNTYVETLPGIFGADMQVSLLNDGPITIIIEM
jgi:D-tyrosyl-tRNA(Tyr) deacylase